MKKHRHGKSETESAEQHPAVGAGVTAGVTVTDGAQALKPSLVMRQMELCPWPLDTMANAKTKAAMITSFLYASMSLEDLSFSILCCLVS